MGRGASSKVGAHAGGVLRPMLFNDCQLGPSAEAGWVPAGWRPALLPKLHVTHFLAHLVWRVVVVLALPWKPNSYQGT